jgi:hypothetical protein
MIPNGMPILRYAPHEFRILQGKVSEHKKGSPGLMAFENVEQLWCGFSLWSVVKRQSRHWFRRCDVRDTP